MLTYFLKICQKGFNGLIFKILLKIWSKSVDWFKRYSKNRYIGHVDLLIKIGQKGFNGLILNNFGENLE